MCSVRSVDSCQSGDIVLSGSADTISDDNINHHSHYTDEKIEVADFITDKGLNFCRGNVVKYVARAGKKDPKKEIEDLRKARWYIDREIRRMEESGK